MPLSSGTRLGPYEVVAPLGAGGMGEVYEALDPRLNRRVALKVLRSEVAADPDRFARFEREGRAVAALNHPNILTVHDVGVHEGTPYVVTELLEGESLREVMSRRTPTQRQVLGWGVAIAHGLAAAHQKGIVHRDLKPENVFLTTDGRIKILDFGLAKQTAPGSVESEAMTASRLSAPGVLMGTVAYMSPEQVQGRPLDARSDLFSFGVVLYELLTKKHPFSRETSGATLGAILSETPPPLASIDPSIPRGIDGIVGRCLEKEREERFQTAHDLGLALEAVLAAPAGSAILEEVEERSPYPGLSSFTEQDADHFFGREEEVRALWAKLRTRHLLAVIGPSGAGKTSFVRAGILPGRPDGWRAIVCTPGRAPMRGLGHALGPELSGDPEALRRLASFEDPETAFELLARWRRNHAEALIVVDQFEELFTLNEPEAQGRFVALLGKLAREADVHVLLSMRDDFLMRCHDHPALSPVFDGLTPLGSISGEGLRRALVEPAKKRGFQFEDDPLVDEMVKAVEGERGALPLLAFAVSRLWEKRDRQRKLLTREAYEAIGGVGGALAQHAEATLDGIGSDKQGIVREMFRNLVTAQGTRASCDREELLSAFSNRPAAEEVLRQLVNARLLTTYEVETKEGGPERHRVEIVHESLLSAWPRHVRWQKQDEEGALLRDQLRQAAHLWDEKGRTGDLLWTGTAYREFDLWKEHYPGALTALEDSFAKAMADKARSQRNRRRMAYAVVLAAVVMIAAGLGMMWRKSARETRRAEQETSRSEAGRLLSLGRLKLADSPHAALAYAIASLEQSDSEAARRFAVEALWQTPPALYFFDPAAGGFSKWSPDGRWLALGGFGAISLWDRETNSSRQLFSAATDVTMNLGFTSDGRRLVSRVISQGRRAILQVWSIPEGRLEQTLEDDEFNEPILVEDHLLTFAPDRSKPVGERPFVISRRALDGSPPETLGRWEPRGLSDFSWDETGTWLYSVQKGQFMEQRMAAPSSPPRILSAREDRGATVWTLPWHGRAVTADKQGTVRIWNVQSGRLDRTLKSPADARRVALDPAGRFIVTYPPNFTPPRTLVLFDLASPRGAEAILLLDDEGGQVHQALFSPDGAWLATNRTTNMILWGLRCPHSTTIGRQKALSPRVRFTRDGYLLSVAEKDYLRRWPLRAASEDQVRDLYFSETVPVVLEGDPDGRFAVIAPIFKSEVAIVPFDGSKRTVHHLTRPEGVGIFSWTGSMSPDGRYLAVTRMAPYRTDLTDIRILDLATGRETALDTHAKKGEGCWDSKNQNAGGASPLWLPDGRLVSDGDAGFRMWDLASGTSEQLRPCRLVKDTFPQLLVTPDFRWIVRLDDAQFHGSKSSLSVFVLSTRDTREIISHGNKLLSFALDPRGSTVVTGDDDGVIRVGPLTGEEPHLLLGHTGKVTSVAVSPDGQWIASTGADGTIRLWPMPDLTKPPLHTWSLPELLAKLKSLTNLRAVRDKASDTGWKIEVGPFPGWKDVPTWQP